MAYALVGRSAPTMDSDDDDVWDDGGADDVRERTAWVDKHGVTACFRCDKAFGALSNRHHHCRECGRVVCGECSPWKDRVKGYAALQRTCNQCHDALSTKETFKRESMNLLRLCPCFRWVKRQVSKHQKRSLLYDGAVFSRRRAPAQALQKAADKLSSFTSSLFGAKTEESNDGDDVGSERVRVQLQPDGTCLSIDNGDELIYLHETQCIKAAGADGLRLLGIAGVPLFEGTLSNPKARDAWVSALSEAVAEAKEAPPPSRSARKPKSRLELATRHSQRERELADRKKAADSRKSKYQTSGMKYTALAMARKGGVV